MLDINIILIVIGLIISCGMIYLKNRQNNKSPQQQNKLIKTQKPQQSNETQLQQQNKINQQILHNINSVKYSNNSIQKQSSPITSSIKKIDEPKNHQNKVSNIKNQNIQIQQNSYKMPSNQISQIILNPVMPKIQTINQQNGFNAKQIILNLYNQSCSLRTSGQYIKFIGPPENVQKLIENYMLQDSIIEQQLKKKIIGYRKIRGDGNCYYTSIGFQYFKILLTKYTESQFQKMLEEIKEMNLVVYYQNFSLPLNMQNELAKALVELLQILRYDSNSLEILMSDPYQEFYGLAIIYLKNLANSLYIQDSQIRFIYQPDLSQEILTWEEQCNNVEMLNSALAKYLKVNIKVYFIDRMNDELIEFSYGEENKDRIHLIFEPGHYDIGIVSFDEH